MWSTGALSPQMGWKWDVGVTYGERGICGVSFILRSLICFIVPRIGCVIVCLSMYLYSLEKFYSMTCVCGILGQIQCQRRWFDGAFLNWCGSWFHGALIAKAPHLSPPRVLKVRHFNFEALRPEVRVGAISSSRPTGCHILQLALACSWPTYGKIFFVDVRALCKGVTSTLCVAVRVRCDDWDREYKGQDHYSVSCWTYDTTGYLNM
jgi:hypothetical protein